MKRNTVYRIAMVVLAMAVAYVGHLNAQPMGPETEKEVLSFIREVNPGLATHMEKVRAINTEEYNRLFLQVSKQYFEIKHLEATKPELAKKMIEAIRLEGQVQGQIEQYKQAGDAQAKEKIKSEIKSSLAQVFDNKIALQEAQAGIIENELQQLKDRIAQKKKHKDHIIEKRITDLTAEKYLSWD